MENLINCKWLFWGVTILISTYYGFRGAVYCSVYKDEMKNWKPWKKAVVWYIQDSIFNFVCGIAGFLAFRLFVKIILSLGSDFSKISPGVGIFLGVLLFVAILGVSGSLPRILSRYGFSGK
jgi:hypothetical protein